MLRTLVLLAGLFFATGAFAQGCGPANPNCIVPTAPPGTSDNRAASTAFVTQGPAGSAVLYTPQTLTGPQQLQAQQNIGIMNVVGVPSVANNTALAAVSITQPAVIRLSALTGGFVYPVIFTYSSSACSLNAGAGDGGSQVQATAGGCWLARFPVAGASPMAWPVYGNGSTDDTTALQAAVTWAGTSGIPLVLDDTHKFLISTGLTTTGTPDIRGTNGHLDVYATSCPAGIIVNSNITAFSATGLTGNLVDVCFQMATSAGTRTSGAAIAIGATSSTQQGNFHVERNTVIFAYNGIVVGGATTGATQTNADVVRDNVIISPSNVGISNGVASYGASTNGTVLDNNQIACFSAASSTTGIVINDGSVHYDGTVNGPYACNNGISITPGSISGNGQLVGGSDLRGVLGDTSLSHDLLIQTYSAAAAVQDIMFTSGWWTAAVGNSTDQPIYIGNAGGGSGRVHNIHFVGGITHGTAYGNTNPLISLQNDVFNILFSGNQFPADNNGTTMIGITLNTTGGGIDIIGNNFGQGYGTLADGVNIQTNPASMTIVGNDFTNIASSGGSPIYWPAPATGQIAVIKDNMGAKTEYDTGISALSCTGLGSGSCALGSFSSMYSGQIILSPTGSPGNSGAIFFTASGPSPANQWICSGSLSNHGSGSWQGTASFIDDSNGTQAIPAWSNAGTNLSAGSTYYLSYSCHRL